MHIFLITNIDFLDPYDFKMETNTNFEEETIQTVYFPKIMYFIVIVPYNQTFNRPFIVNSSEHFFFYPKKPFSDYYYFLLVSHGIIMIIFDWTQKPKSNWQNQENDWKKRKLINSQLDIPTIRQTNHCRDNVYHPKQKLCISNHYTMSRFTIRVFISSSSSISPPSFSSHILTVCVRIELPIIV